MTITTLQDFRERLSEHIKRIGDDRDELVVLPGTGEPVVVMAQAELHALRETLHLFSSRANAERLSRSVASLDQGLGEQRVLSPE